MSKNDITDLFLDECGYTGPDLWNAEQPVFVLASHNFSEEESVEIGDQYFGNVKAKELKHTQLSKRPRQQRMVIEFIKFLDEHRGRFKLFYMHKRYALCGKIIDLFIETSMKAMDYDLYEQGANLGMLNMMHYCIPAFSDHDYYDSLLLAFQKMVFDPQKETADNFWELLNAHKSPEQLDNILDYIRVAMVHVGVPYISQLERADLEVVFSPTVVLLAQWGKELGTPIRLFHDESTLMASKKPLWDLVTSPDFPDNLVGYDRRTMQFPIGVHETVFKSSIDLVGLQIADILAGATTSALRYILNGQPEDDSYGRELLGIIGEWSTTGSLWPHDAVTPKELGTTGPAHDDPIEFMMSMHRKAMEEK